MSVSILAIVIVTRVPLASGEDVDIKGIERSVKTLLGVKDYDGAIGLLKGNIEKSDHPALILMLAEVYEKANRNHEAARTVQGLIGQLERSEREKPPLSSLEKNLLIQANAKLESLCPLLKEFKERRRQIVDELLKVAREAAGEKDYVTAQLAVEDVLKLEPDHPVAKKILDTLRGSISRHSVTFREKESMQVYPVGTSMTNFPKQETEDPLGPFHGKPVYFHNNTANSLVYDVETNVKVLKLRFQGAAFFQMRIEILDGKGRIVYGAGPFDDGNVSKEKIVSFAKGPLSQFQIRISNRSGGWFLVERLSLE